MDWYYYVAWAAIVAQGLFLYNAVRNYRYAVVGSRKKRQAGDGPRVTLIVPCKGLDARFEANVSAYLRQDYANYHLLFVVEAQTDPAYAQLARMTQEPQADRRALDMQTLIAGPCTACSQKIHNLLHAFRHVAEDTEILAFGDSDVCVPTDWLRRLVRPLRRRRYGLTTGYRWFIPTQNNLATLALSAINAAIAQLLGNNRFNHAWGGSMAIRIEDFRRLHIPQVWRSTLSDDLSLTRAVKKAGMRVRFVPACLVPSFESTTWPKLCEFARRQFLITRVYSPAAWWLGFVSSLGSAVGLWGGLALAVYAGAVDSGHVGLYAAVPAVFFAGQIIRATLRQAMAIRTIPDGRAQLRAAAAADILGCWFWSVLLVAFLLASACGRTIRWRGIRYRLISPMQTEVLGG